MNLKTVKFLTQQNFFDVQHPVYNDAKEKWDFENV